MGIFSLCGIIRGEGLAGGLVLCRSLHALCVARAMAVWRAALENQHYFDRKSIF